MKKLLFVLIFGCVFCVAINTPIFAEEMEPAAILQEAVISEGHNDGQEALPEQLMVENEGEGDESGADPNGQVGYVDETVSKGNDTEADKEEDSAETGADCSDKVVEDNNADPAGEDAKKEAATSDVDVTDGQKSVELDVEPDLNDVEKSVVTAEEMNAVVMRMTSEQREGDDTDTSPEEPDVFNGVREDEDGNLHYYVNGIIDPEYTGLAWDAEGLLYYVQGETISKHTGVAQDNADNGWYYYKNGDKNTTYTGIAKDIDKVWYRIKNGEVDFDYKGVAWRPENGNWYFMKDGILDWSYTGIGKDPESSKWYRVRNGQVDFSFNGLAKRPENGNWYYLKDGELDWTYTGVGENPNTKNLYRVKKGQVDFKFNGLAKRPEDGGWYFLRDGMFRIDYTGIGQNPNNTNWYRVKNGMVDFGFNGLAKRPEDGGWYFLRNGMFRIDYTGIGQNPDNTNWYRVKNGMVDFAFNGLAKRPEDGDWYFLKGGMFRNTYTGIGQNPDNKNWYRVKGGKVDFSFNGVTERPENKNWYYLKDGMLRWGYTGIAKNPDDNSWYRVEKGMVNWDYTGGALRPENGNWYYIKDGKLDWSFSGLDKVESNKVYYYKNGIRQNKETQEWNGVTYYFDTKTAAMLYSINKTEAGLLYVAPVSNGKIVALDPGHSYVIPAGVEPLGPGSGAMKEKDTYGTLGWATGLKEADLNLAVATKLRTELLGRGYSVILTRENNDTAVSCVDRTNVANTIGADAYIRLHGNGDTSCKSGALTMCITQANTWQSAHYTDCSRLSEDVLDEYCKETGLPRIGVWYVDTLTGNNWAQVPTTLIEMGNMCNGYDDRWMADETHQFTMAEGIANGIDVFFGIS